MIQITVPFSKSLTSSVSLSDTFVFLSSTDSTRKYFPGIQKLQLLYGNIHEWIFKKFSYGGYELDITFKTSIKLTPEGLIEIEPFPENEKTSLKAAWVIKEGVGKVTASFTADFKTELPLPSLMRAMIEPMAKKELTKLFDRYIDNVAQALS